MHGVLLEDLARQLGCYISELRAESFQKDVERLLEQYAFEKYSLEECAYSLSYIYNETVLFTDYEQVRQFVRERQAEIQNRE